MSLAASVDVMKESARYVKIVEWSDEDQCFVGSCPGLFYGGCHGEDEKAVFAELCEIVDETIALYKNDGKPLPPITCGKPDGSLHTAQDNAKAAPEQCRTFRTGLH